MTKQRCFTITEKQNHVDLQAVLGGGYTLSVTAALTQEWCIHDTFDWRLYNRGLILRQVGDEYVLASLTGGASEHAVVAGLPPRFAWNFPQYGLRTRLEPILNQRALLPLTGVSVSTRICKLRNEEGKTLVHLRRMSADASQNGVGVPPVTIVCLRAKRGYGKLGRRLAGELGCGEAISSPEAAIYRYALTAAGLTPNSYSSTFKVELTQAMRADEATKAILGQLFAALQANEAGIRADLDTEYLHDYRVAVRRTRAALRELRGVFSDATTERFRTGFRAVGKATNELRDLDVYLLAEADYQAMLPAPLQDAIKPLFVMLGRRRAAALANTVDFLDSAEYAQFTADWATFLLGSADEAAAGKDAATPIVDLARKRIYKRYRRIIKNGAYVVDHMEDDLLHALRLECKRLRYLLEFFAALFPSQTMARLIGQLKRLQNNLGDFTDLAVQQEALLAQARALPLDHPDTPHALLAAGALIDALARQQAEVKAEFAAAFSQFARRANQKRYRTLFKDS